MAIINAFIMYPTLESINSRKDNSGPQVLSFIKRFSSKEFDFLNPKIHDDNDYNRV